jgi:serine/threonine protein phosphatase PrpC
VLNAPWPAADGGGGGREKKPARPAAPRAGPATWLLDDDASSGAGTPLDLAPPLPGDRARSHAAVAAPGEAGYTLAAVFDGHNGAQAAAHCAAELAAAVRARLPPGAPPPGGVDTDDEEDGVGPDDSAASASAAAATAWRGGLAAALAGAFHELQHTWAGRGRLGGCTATVLLQAGRLATVANVGDSLALLDSGASVMPLTGDHR